MPLERFTSPIGAHVDPERSVEGQVTYLKRKALLIPGELQKGWRNITPQPIATGNKTVDLVCENDNTAAVIIDLKKAGYPAEVFGIFIRQGKELYSPREAGRIMLPRDENPFYLLARLVGQPLLLYEVITNALGVPEPSRGGPRGRAKTLVTA